jgi:hypothetical protein
MNKTTILGFVAVVMAFGAGCSSTPEARFAETREAGTPSTLASAPVTAYASDAGPMPGDFEMSFSAPTEEVRRTAPAPMSLTLDAESKRGELTYGMDLGVPAE